MTALHDTTGHDAGFSADFFASRLHMTELHDTTGHDAGFYADFFASRLQGRALEQHDTHKPRLHSSRN